MKVKSESEVAQSCLFVTPWTAAYQAPWSMGFSRQEYWNGVPLPSPSLVRREDSKKSLDDLTAKRSLKVKVPSPPDIVLHLS